jgi:hypothetical protein
MRLVALVVLTVSSSAFAQPGAGAPPPPPGYPPPPYQYAPQQHYPVQLTAEEHELLLDGEISDGQHFGGVAANIFVGLGVGQAIQGRWGDTGWIFTLGEGASSALAIYGMVELLDNCVHTIDESDCDDDNGVAPLLIGLLGVTVFRTWSIIDAATGPGEHNRRLRSLKFRLGIPVQVAPYLRKTTDDGATAGLTLRF